MNRLGVNRSGKKVVGLVGMGSPHHLRTSHQVGGTGVEGGGRVEEVFAGLQAGTFFSLSALACKLGFILGARCVSTFISIVWQLDRLTARVFCVQDVVRVRAPRPRRVRGTDRVRAGVPDPGFEGW